MDGQGLAAGSERARRPHRILVGRESALAQFDELLDAGGRGVVLHGPAGIGKTLLGEELVDRAERRGWRTAVLRCRAASVDLHLGAFLPLLPPDLHTDPGTPLLLAARTAMLQWVGDGPALLGVDDAHLIDPTSAALLHQLVTSGKVAVVLTYRSGEWVPDAVAQLWHEGLVAQWEVGPLDAADNEAAAEAMGAPPMPPEVAARLFELTDGNPLHLHSIVRGVPPEALTSVAALDDAAASSPTMVDFVESRLGRLSPAGREALNTVALAEPISLEVVEGLVGPEALLEVEAEDFVTVVEDGKRLLLRLTHPLYGEILRRRMSRLRARAVYRTLVDAIQAQGSQRREDVLRAAQWSVDAGLQPDPGLLLQAGMRAMEAFDPVLVERLVGPLWDRSRDLVAGHLLAYAWYVGGDPERLDRHIEELAGRVADPHMRAVVRTLQFDNALYRLADADRALRALDADGEVDDAKARRELDARRTSLAAFTLERAQAEALGAPFLAAGRPNRPTITAIVALANLRASSGDPEASLAATEGAVDHATGAPVYATPLRVVLTCRSRPLLMLGRLREAEEMARLSLAITVDDGDDVNAAISAFTLAWVLLWRGRPRSGLDVLVEHTPVLHSAHYATFERWTQMTEGLLAAVLGDVDRARRALDRVEALSPNVVRVLDGFLWHARVALAMADRDPERARELAREAAAALEADGLAFEEATVRHLQVRLGDTDGLARLQALGARGGLTATLAAHATALAGQDPTGLGEAAEAFTTAGADALAAAAAADASEAHARAGDQRAARRWARRSTELGAFCEHGVVPHAPVVAVTPLSRREREVAELAAAGLRSRDIAERLYLSTRTVDNHLARVYDKLGVRNREALGEVLGIGTTASAAAG
jgi:DNA-binding NarL/FixJ family response regulator